MRKSKSKSSQTLEALEDRRLMTAAWIPYEMSQVALHYPKHVGTTNLYLNFEGGSLNDTQAGGSKTIAAYTAPSGQDLNKSIQDIVYRTAEIFSPFNVRVRVMHGAGNFSKTNGDTTIFVGDNAANHDSAGHNTAYSVTPNASVDLPGSNKGFDHIPNSDAYDIGFVDATWLNHALQQRRHPTPRRHPRFLPRLSIRNRNLQTSHQRIPGRLRRPIHRQHEPLHRNHPPTPRHHHPGSPAHRYLLNHATK